MSAMKQIQWCFETPIGQLWDNFQAVLGQLCVSDEIIPLLLWDNSRAVLRRHYVSNKTTLLLLWDNSRTALRQLWGSFGTTLCQQWNNSMVALRKLYAYGSFESNQDLLDDWGKALSFKKELIRISKVFQTLLNVALRLSIFLNTFSFLFLMLSFLFLSF